MTLLDAKSLLRLAVTNRQLCALAMDDVIWKSVFLRDVGHLSMDIKPAFSWMSVYLAACGARKALDPNCFAFRYREQDFKLLQKRTIVDPWRLLRRSAVIASVKCLRRCAHAKHDVICLRRRKSFVQPFRDWEAYRSVCLVLPLSRNWMNSRQYVQLDILRCIGWKNRVKK